MGIEYGEQTENLNNNNKGLLDPNYKGPSFYLNKNYPNDDNLTLEEILRQYLEVKNYSFNNNNEIINNQIEENSLTPKFNTKNDRTNIKALNISTNPNNDQKEDDQIININKNSLIKDNESNIIPNINNSNININININIDLPKNKKSQSIIKTLQNSYQENNIKSKKSKTKEFLK